MKVDFDLFWEKWNLLEPSGKVWYHPKISLFLRMMASLSEFFHIFFTVDILIRLWLKLLNPPRKVCHQTRLFHSAVASTANNVHKRASAARRVSFQINQQDCPQSFFLTWKQWNQDIWDVNLITLNGCSFYTSLTFVLIYLDGIPMEGKKANSSILLEKQWSTIGCQGSIAIVKGVPVVNVETLQIRKEWRVTCHSSETKWARNMICCFLLTKFLSPWKNLISDHHGHQ